MCLKFLTLGDCSYLKMHNKKCKVIVVLQLEIKDVKRDMIP